MEIRYCMTRAEAWRFNSRILFRNRANWVVWALNPAGITWLTYWQYPSVQASLHLRSSHIWWLPAVFLGTYGIGVGLWSALIWKLADSHYPNADPPLVSTTVLTPDGLLDTQRKLVGRQLSLTQIHILWEDISRIYQQDGDIYFQRKAGAHKAGTNVIPRSAFDNPREGQRFYEQAVAYWNAAKHGVLLPTEDAAVWPPAPRPGV